MTEPQHFLKIIKFRLTHPESPYAKKVPIGLPQVQIPLFLRVVQHRPAVMLPQNIQPRRQHDSVGANFLREDGAVWAVDSENDGPVQE